jgi:hypothetical protein
MLLMKWAVYIHFISKHRDKERLSTLILSINTMLLLGIPTHYTILQIAVVKFVLHYITICKRTTMYVLATDEKKKSISGIPSFHFPPSHTILQ